MTIGYKSPGDATNSSGYNQTTKITTYPRGVTRLEQSTISYSSSSNEEETIDSYDERVNPRKPTNFTAAKTEQNYDPSGNAITIATITEMPAVTHYQDPFE